MTRDIDLVVALDEHAVEALVTAFQDDFYVDADVARAAARNERMFNLMHLESGIKVDFILRKSASYRRAEFARRGSVTIAGIQTWIVSREDPILSKLVWALDSGSELQRRDVRALLEEAVDLEYIRQWAPQLGVASLLAELMP